MAKQSTIITDGTAEIELVWDSSSQPNWRLQFNERVEGGSPRPQWHRPQSAPPELIELASNTGEARFRLNIRQDDDIDTVLNKIVELSRWIDGENQQAARYHTHGDVDRIELKVQRKNATNATVWPIVFGEIDDGGAHYTEMADFREWAEGVTIRLFLAPYGEAETAITLRNRVVNPHCVEDSDGDGVADGWATVGTPDATSVATNRWLIGGRTQYVRVPNTGSHGIRTQSVVVGQGTNGLGYLWIFAKPTEDTITIQLTDGSNNIIDAATFNPASPSGFSKSAVKIDSSGTERTWYRYVLSGTNSTASGFRLRAFRASGDASSETEFRVDGAYFDTGISSAPEAWMSLFAIDNRNDPTDANPSQINYIDVWGVPGDAPALVNIELDWSAITGADKDLIVAGRGVDGRILAADQTGWIESDDFSTSLTFNASWSTGTGTSNDHFFRLTQDGTANPGSGNLTITISGAAARQLLTKPVRVFARCRGSDTAATFQLSAVQGFYDSGEVSLSSTGVWSMLDMGVLNGQGLAPLDQPDSSSPDVTLTFQVEDLPASGSDTADFDALLLIPVDEFMVVDSSTVFTTSKSAHIRGQHEDFIVDTHGFAATGRLGTLWTLEPGNKMNRLRFGVSATSDKQWDLTDAANVTLTIIPRTRHLLGTT